MPVWFNAFEARLQVLRLARENDIEINWIAGWLRAEAYVAARWVSIPDPTSRPCYMTALHELGHVIAGPSERAAWDWAHLHATVR